MRELVASGMIVDTDDLKIAASVYFEGNNESGSTSGNASGEEGTYEVTLKAKNYNCDDLAADAMKFADLEKWCDELVVPGYGENDAVVLEAPAAIRYSKTKSFECNGKYCTFFSLRYSF